MSKALWDAADGIGTITMNAPEVKNAFDEEMVGELATLFERAAADPTIRVIVFTGAGDAFCAGGNVKAMGDSYEPVERKQLMQHHIHRVPIAISRIDKPIIAMINGAAFGAGLDMALACDLRVASTTAKLAESYINLGLIAGDGGAYLLPRLIGMPRALELLLTGRTLTGAEAAELGMVNRAVPPEQLREATWELAGELASKPPLGLATMKRLVYQSQTTDLATALELASSQLAILQCGPEHRQAVQDFRERDAARRSGGSGR